MPKSREQYIDDLIGEGEAVTVKLPPALAHKLYELGHRRYGYLKRPALMPKAVVYAAALGTLAWAAQYASDDRKGRRGPKPKAKAKDDKAA